MYFQTHHETQHVLKNMFLDVLKSSIDYGLGVKYPLDILNISSYLPFS